MWRRVGGSKHRGLGAGWSGPHEEPVGVLGADLPGELEQIPPEDVLARRGRDESAQKRGARSLATQPGSDAQKQPESEGLGR